MRILLVNTLYPPQARGGAEKSVHLLAHALAARACAVTVLACSDRDGDYVHQDGDVRVVRLRQRNFYQWPSDRAGRFTKVAWHLRDIYNRAMAGAALQALHGEEFDVINTNNLTGFSAALVPALAKTFRAPVVHTLRDYSLLCTRGTLFKDGRCAPQRCLSCRVVTGAKRFQGKHFSGVIGISQAVLQHHLDAGYFPNTLPSAVIPNIFGTTAAATGTFRLRKAAGELRTVGFLGRITPEKGVPGLCEAFLEHPRTRQAVLQIAGDHASPYATALVRKYARPNIQFVGPVDPARFLPGLDVLVVPSLWDEPLGRVALEAIAQGCPVLGAERGGLSDTIRHTKGGWLYRGERPDLGLVQPIDAEIDLSYCSAPAVAGRHLEFFRRVTAGRA